MIERIHRQFKVALECQKQDWLNALPTVMLGLRSTPRDATGISCAEMAIGTTLRLPGEFYTSTSEEEIQDSTEYV